MQKFDLDELNDKIIEDSTFVEAIFDESEVPDEWSNFTKLNYEFFGQEYTG